VHALVAASPTVAAGLAPEWRQRPLTRHRSSEPNEPNEPADVVLVEIGDDGVPGWADLDALTRTLTGLVGEDAAVVLWFTGDTSVGVVPTTMVEFAAAVYAIDEPTATSVTERFDGVAVQVLGVAAQPRLYNPAVAGPGERRHLGACLVLDPTAPRAEDTTTLRELVSTAVQPLPREDLDLWRCAEAAVPPADRLPGRLRKRLVGSVPATRLPALTSSYRVLLDAGRQSSASAWSVVEAGAAQTAVVTTPENVEAMPSGMAELVPSAAEPKALRSELVARLRQPELRDREGLLLHRAMLEQHTYSHRVGQILEAVGHPSPAPSRTVSAVVPTNRWHEIDNVLTNIGRQAHPDVELVLVLHGITPDPVELRRRAVQAGLGSFEVVEADSALTLGACMNLGVEAASGAYIAKMDDDNFYGAHFLTDLLGAFEYTDAGIVGEWAHYVWLRDSNAVVLRNVAAEHTMERRIQGGSMLFEGDLVRALRFGDLPRAVDSDILDRATAAGVGIYSGDRYNYVSIRNADRHSHTWTVADSTFMTATGRLVFYGDPRPHVDV